MPAGRPSGYSEDLTDIICAGLAEGKALRTVLAENKGMPSMSTVFNWLRTYPEFLQKYETSKAEAADAMSDEMLYIADDDNEDVQRSRLRIDTRKWLASKLKPKKYGDRQTIEHEVGDDLAERLQRGRNRVSNSGQNSTDSDQKG